MTSTHQKHGGTERALAAYSSGARGRLATERLKAVGGYAAAVGAGLAMTGAADAAIIYSGIQNISVTFTGTAGQDFTFLDLDGIGASHDVQLQVWRNGEGTGNFAGAWMWGSDVRYGAVTNGGQRRFASGDTIGAGVTLSNSTGLLNGGSGPGFNSLGNWNLSSSGLAGFQFKSSGNYGWIRLLVEDLNGNGTPDRLTAVDWAYEDGGAAIQAGDTGASGASVPVPAPLALLALGGVGIAATRRRAKAARH